jgi:predicted alpha/beta-hydrolase family hydrolase
VLLGHGAGGGIEAADLLAARAGARLAGWAVILLEQPWRVAGRRVAPAPRLLDEAGTAVLEQLRSADRLTAGASLVLGGRSAGARVACRLAEAAGAEGVLCMAFPLHPPGRPERSRAPELAAAAATCPTLVLQGTGDPFGSPDEIRAAVPAARCLPVPGTHTLGTAPARRAVRDAVRQWLVGLPGSRGALL